MSELFVADIDLLNQETQRFLSIRVTYAADNVEDAVIIFSHGAGGSHLNYKYLVEYWAKRGFICIQPVHEDSIELNARRKTRTSFIKTLRDLPTNKAAWVQRVRDISFVIDSLHPLSETVPALRKNSKKRTIGVGGHSLGAFTAQLIGGARLPLSTPDDDIAPPLRDHRVQAILALSPQGIRRRDNALGFDNRESFADLSLPTLFETGDKDISLWNDASQRQEAFELCKPGDKYFVTIDGADHMIFVGERVVDVPKIGQSLWDAAVGGIGLGSQATPENKAKYLRLIEKSTSTFWEAFLKHDPDALQAFRNGALGEIIGTDGSWKQK